MKKTMAMLLSAAMVMSMGLMASAATQDYSVLVDGDKADYIVKPQTYGDLLRNNTVPEWLNG